MDWILGFRGKIVNISVKKKKDVVMSSIFKKEAVP